MAVSKINRCIIRVEYVLYSLHDAFLCFQVMTGSMVSCRLRAYSLSSRYKAIAGDKSTDTLGKATKAGVLWVMLCTVRYLNNSAIVVIGKNNLPLSGSFIKPYLS